MNDLIKLSQLRKAIKNLQDAINTNRKAPYEAALTTLLDLETVFEEEITARQKELAESALLLSPDDPAVEKFWGDMATLADEMRASGEL